jgi:hypothetical protein
MFRKRASEEEDKPRRYKSEPRESAWAQ